MGVDVAFVTGLVCTGNQVYSAGNQGIAIEKESKDVLTKAAKNSPELKVAMETWKEIKFEFDTVDKLDVAHK